MPAGVVRALLLAGAVPVVASLGRFGLEAGLEAVKGAAVDVGAIGGPSSCGAEVSVPDCDRLDVGSCGNACCVLEASSPEAPEAVYKQVKDFLSSGGASGAYAYVTGASSSGQNPGDDLRPYNSTPPKPFQFILQGTHTSLKKKYVDTLDFNIRADSGTGSVLRMFSSSGIHGALGDEGQNYKSLVYLLDGVGFDRSSLSAPLYGCGSTSGAEARWVSWLPALIGACLLAHTVSSVVL